MVAASLSAGMIINTVGMFNIFLSGRPAWLETTRLLALYQSRDRWRPTCYHSVFVINPVAPPESELLDKIDVSSIAERVALALSEVPDYVQIVAAAKARIPEDVMAAVQAGVHIIGENYVRDARSAKSLVGSRAQWHFIGRLREHDVRASTLALFDMIQSVDSLQLGQRIDEKCRTLGRSMDVLIEVNSGREAQKAGVFPEEAEALVRQISALHNVRVCGLMTMGPLMVTQEAYRPCFAETHGLFLKIRESAIPGVSMEVLSMGTSDSYAVAIEEGANMVRIGSALFGPR